jgi:hypothetical protein
MNLSVNSTAIRSLVETKMHQLHVDGLITTKQREAVMSINGHSSKTTEDYYILKDRAAQVTDARAAFLCVGGVEGVGGEGGEGVEGVEGVEEGGWGVGVEENEEEGGEVGEVGEGGGGVEGGEGGGGGVSGIGEGGGNAISQPLQPLPLPAGFLQATNSASPASVASPASFGSPVSVGSLLSQWQQSDVLVVAPWGTAHPVPNTPNLKRAEWTDDEVAYIGKWCDAETQQFPHRTNVVAACLKHIKLDRAAVRIFHALHVTDSARLRNGYRIWPKLQQRLLEEEEMGL